MKDVRLRFTHSTAQSRRHDLPEVPRKQCPTRGCENSRELCALPSPGAGHYPQVIRLDAGAILSAREEGCFAVPQGQSRISPLMRGPWTPQTGSGQSVNSTRHFSGRCIRHRAAASANHSGYFSQSWNAASEPTRAEQSSIPLQSGRSNPSARGADSSDFFIKLRRAVFQK